MKTAVIMRGLPGAGKTTIAVMLVVSDVERKKIFSTDSFFNSKEGYKFDFEKLGEFHSKNQAAFEEACKQSVELVICDNTNMKRAHMQPYIESAKKYDYTIVELLVGDPKDEEHIALCVKRNSHGVPEAKIRQMSEGFEL